jgi:hypothetical protein
MPRRFRPARHGRDGAATLAHVARRRLIRPVSRRLTVPLLAGTALALASVGSAAAASAPDDPSSGIARHAHVGAHLGPRAARQSTLRADTSSPARQAVRLPTAVASWRRLGTVINRQARPPARLRALPSADQLMPVGTTGPQTWMPISGPQLANATTIVKQALAMRMGIRSAVIAVATAMQESRLENLGYGDADSLGLFQQRPSCGWGTAEQIMNPSFAASAFLAALQRYQADNPDWAAQPLWASAQGAQKSGVPLAYAQWEAQAASLVKQVASSQ